MVTDQDLFRIYQEAGNPVKARRALFEAGRRAEREGEGEDSLLEYEMSDTIIGLNGNYELRAVARTGE